MLQKPEVIALLQDSLQSLRRSGIVETDANIESETVLFGAGSFLDSIGFVTFVTDVEERLNRRTGRDVYIILTDLEELYPGSQQLTASMFADYLTGLIKE